MVVDSNKGGGVQVEALAPLRGSGWTAARYRLHRPFSYTGVEAVDAALSSYEVAVSPPPGGLADAAPVVVVLEAISTPYRRAEYLIPLLHGAGCAAILFETPLSGSRSLVGDGSRNPARELAPLIRHGVDVSPGLMRRLMEGTAGDFEAVSRLALDRHGLSEARPGGRLALFGISFGCLLSSFAFMAGGVGTRLLGVIGHADLPSFAAGLRTQIQRHLNGLPLGRLAAGPVALLRPLAERHFGPDGVGALYLWRLLDDLVREKGETGAANPMSYHDRVGGHRRVRLLVGAQDEVARPADAEGCVRRLPDAGCRVEPCLAHGYVTCGPSYSSRLRDFIRQELGGWEAA